MGSAANTGGAKENGRGRRDPARGGGRGKRVRGAIKDSGELAAEVVRRRPSGIRAVGSSSW